MKELTFAEKAYKHTKLDADYTERKIKKMLEELGISQMRTTKNGEDYVFEFIVHLFEGQPPRKVRINLPTGKALKKDAKHLDQEKNAMFRVLYYNLKNRFVTVTNGLKEFEDEFAMDLVVKVNGGEYRLGDILIPEIQNQIKQGGTLAIARNN